MRPPQPTAERTLSPSTRPRPANAVAPMVNACQEQCLRNFSVCGYLAWETEDYCNQEFANCLAGC